MTFDYVFQIPEDKIQHRVKLNEYHPKMKFTVQNPNNNNINFLDITIGFNGYFFTTN